MLDPALANKSQQARRDAVASAVDDAIRAGTFNYTEFLLSAEPMRSDVCEFLDGVTVEGTIPRGTGDGAQHWNGEPVLLVHVDPQGSIVSSVRERVKVPGTNGFRMVKSRRNFGNVARVPDAYPERTARMILAREGWPNVQMETNGARDGSVVEWRWLEREASSPTPSAGTVELYQEILTRPGFAEAAGLAKPKAKTKTAGAEQGQLGA